MSKDLLSEDTDTPSSIPFLNFYHFLMLFKDIPFIIVHHFDFIFSVRFSLESSQSPIFFRRIVGVQHLPLRAAILAVNLPSRAKSN